MCVIPAVLTLSPLFCLWCAVSYSDTKAVNISQEPKHLEKRKRKEKKEEVQGWLLLFLTAFSLCLDSTVKISVIYKAKKKKKKSWATCWFWIIRLRFFTHLFLVFSRSHDSGQQDFFHHFAAIKWMAAMLKVCPNFARTFIDFYSLCQFTENNQSSCYNKLAKGVTAIKSNFIFILIRKWHCISDSLFYLNLHFRQHSSVMISECCTHRSTYL